MVADMAVSLASILTNLMVISAIRDTEAAASPTFNLVLANLCCANLARAVLVKVAASSGPFLKNLCLSMDPQRSSLTGRNKDL